MVTSARIISVKMKCKKDSEWIATYK